MLCYLIGVCCGSWPHAMGCRPARETSSRSRPIDCTVLYCTVLYCTILYYTIDVEKQAAEHAPLQAQPAPVYLSFGDKISQTPAQALSACIGWHYLSNATCLMRPRSFYALFVASRITVICKRSRPL